MRVFLLVLLLSSVALAASSFFSTRPDNDPTYSELVEGLPEEENEAVILQSFQGSYTSSGGYLSNLHICVQDDNTVQGSYDQAGIIQGEIRYRTDGKPPRLSGNFYEAGTYDCQTGTFEIDLTTWGFSGKYTCDGTSTSYKWEEVRLNIARPSNDQCAILTDEDVTLEGVWEDDADLPISICIKGNGKVSASYTIAPSPSYWANPLANGYFEGTSYLDGKVLGGTWYETQGRNYNFKAGAMLMLYRESGDLQIYKWTGLNGGEGETAIDPTQIFDETKHQLKNFRFYMGEANSDDCIVNDGNKGFVLLNLHDDDDDYFYFVGSDWFNSQYLPVYDVVGAEYLHPPTSGAASLSVAVSFLLLCLSLFV